MRLTIERLGHHGDGVAAGGIFVPRALPGEVVEGVVAEGRMAAPAIVTPAPERVRPPCRHYRGCGGCALQHAADGFVADWKQQVVARALLAHGLAPPFRPIHTSPPASRRRAVLAGRRVKSGALVGFHGRGSDQIVAVPDCTVLHPELRAALPALEAVTRAAASRRGALGLAVTQSAAGVDLDIRGGGALSEVLRLELTALAAEHRLARVAWQGEVLLTRAPPLQPMGRAQVLPPPGGFLQATSAGEAALLAAVQECLDGAGRIADLFAGCGTFALPLAEAAEVYAAEGDAAALVALAEGWRHAPGLHRVKTERRDLFRQPLSAAELGRFDAVVIDPPRAGAAAQVAQIAAAPLHRLAYVSCNPVSFARDAANLVQAGFRLQWVQVVDQFRWSTHVELAACFARRHIRDS